MTIKIPIGTLRREIHRARKLENMLGELASLATESCVLDELDMLTDDILSDEDGVPKDQRVAYRFVTKAQNASGRVAEALSDCHASLNEAAEQVELARKLLQDALAEMRIVRSAAWKARRAKKRRA